MQLYYSTEDLVLRAKQKDQLAMKLLYEKAAKPMYNLSYRITNNVEDSKDVVQEAFVTSFNQLQKLSEPKRYFGWLKRIVVNDSIKVSKSRVYYKALENLPIIDDVPESSYSQFSAEILKKAIQSLPNGCREILTLFLFEDYKHREIAELLGIKISTSKSQYQYALKLLRSNLEKYNV
ncbi:MAG: RNA polymerase sigma factor [Winogradskyella sp.]|nr:MAG: RNA polymerase sigma factor [Winogradskyella sp.]